MTSSANAGASAQPRTRGRQANPRAALGDDQSSTALSRTAAIITLARAAIAQVSLDNQPAGLRENPAAIGG